MRNIINMTIEQAIATIKEMGLEVCIEMNHDTVKGLTIGCPFSDHYEATAKNGIITSVKMFRWASIIC